MNNYHENLFDEINQRRIGRGFDFTDDCAYGDYYLNEKSVWRRYFLYKNDLGAEDPDSKSLFLQKLYRELWPGVEDKDYMMLDSYALDTYSGEATEKLRSVCGDTMNSVTTTLNHIPSICGDSLRKMARHYLSLGEDDQKFERDLTSELWWKLWETGEEAIITDMLHDFLKDWHTIGNFIPVPLGFNRGRYQTTRDYWDLTLLAIYKWYHGEKGAIKNLITDRNPNSQNKAVQNTIKWLSDFQRDGKPSWQVFVEENYMQSFVEKDGDTYGMPKELWPGHFSSQVMPYQIDELELFFTNVTQWISERSSLMLMKTKYEEIYQNIINEYGSRIKEVEKMIENYDWNYTENNYEGHHFETTDGFKIRTKAIMEDNISSGDQVVFYKDNQSVCEFSYTFYDRLYTKILEPIIFEIEKEIGYQRNISTAVAEYLYGIFCMREDK